MTTPDLSTLPLRMRYAAEVIDEATERCPREERGPHDGWNASGLLKFAAKWQAEDTAAAAREGDVNVLARMLCEANGTTKWVGVAPETQEIWRAVATMAIDIALRWHRG